MKIPPDQLSQVTSMAHEGYLSLESLFYVIEDN